MSISCEKNILMESWQEPTVLEDQSVEAVWVEIREGTQW